MNEPRFTDTDITAMQEILDAHGSQDQAWGSIRFADVQSLLDEVRERRQVEKLIPEQRLIDAWNSLIEEDPEDRDDGEFEEWSPWSELLADDIERLIRFGRRLLASAPGGQR